MAFKRWILIGLTTVIFTGCSTDTEKQENKNETQQNEQKQETPSKDEEELTFNDSSQASDDTELTEINKSVEDPDGTVTLKKYAKPNEEQKSDLISLTVAEVKVLDYAPSVDLIDFFHGYTEKDKFPYVRVNVRIKNNGKEKVHFNPVSEMKTDQGETVKWSEDFYLEKLNGELQPGEEKVGSLGFIIDETDPEKLKNITITSSEVINDKKKKIADPLTFKLDFE